MSAEEAIFSEPGKAIWKGIPGAGTASTKPLSRAAFGLSEKPGDPCRAAVGGGRRRSEIKGAGPSRPQGLCES